VQVNRVFGLSNAMPRQGGFGRQQQAAVCGRARRFTDNGGAHQPAPATGFNPVRSTNTEPRGALVVRKW